MKLITFITILYWNFKQASNLQTNKLILPNQIYANYTIFFANLIQVYENYHRVYHIESSSGDVFDDVVTLLRKSYVRRTFSVYNYDDLKNPEEYMRPNAARILHIIYTNNPRHLQILTQPYKILYRDVTIFVTTNSSKESKLMYQNAELVKLAGKILLVEIVNSSSEGILLYQICHYCGNLSRTLMPILGKPSLRTLFPYNYKDLNEHLLNLAFVPNYPFVYCNDFKSDQNTSMDHCIDIDGIESHMVRLISRKMNFKFKAYTLQMRNASFLNMLKRVSVGQFDLAFGSISITLDRRKIIQYTISYNVEDYNMLYKISMSFFEVLKKFFDPFSDQMLWLLFISSQILLVILLVGIQMMERRWKRRKSLVDCFWLLLQIQLEQSIPSKNFSISSTSTTPKPTSTSMKMFTKYTSSLLLLWCLTCLVLCSAYKGVTLSTLLNPPKTEPQGLVELLQRGYGLASSYRSSDIVQDLLFGLPYQPTVYFGQSNCEVFSVVQQSKVAMLNEWSILQYQLKKNCPKLDPKVENMMLIARKPVRNAGHAWATQPGASFKPAMDYYLSLILSGGLYVKWTRDNTASGGIRPFRLSREQQKHMRAASLPLTAFSPLLIVYIICISFSFAIFVSELIFFYVYQSRRQNNRLGSNARKS